MSLACRLKGHDPSPDEICNGPHCFTRCRRCGGDLVKKGEAWQPVPKGFRVVWPAEPTPEDAPTAEEAPAPMPRPLPPTPPAPQATPVSGDGEAPLVLVCDDDALVADLLSHRLSARGYRVDVAADGREALERVAEERPDAILLDAMMPMIDGYEVLRRLRADPATAAIPVIMLTARKQEDDIVGALQLGADDFVVKPFIPEEVMSRLARLLAGAA
jgi:CheY-like chemotaxis protein